MGLKHQCIDHPRAPARRPYRYSSMVAKIVLRSPILRQGPDSATRVDAVTSGAVKASDATTTTAARRKQARQHSGAARAGDAAGSPTRAATTTSTTTGVKTSSGVWAST